MLQNLDYVSDLLVGKEAHVYKYADRQSMFFDCQITLNIKEPGQQYCDVPNCPDPPRRSRRTLNKRDNNPNSFNINKTTLLKRNIIKEDYLISKDLIEAKNFFSENFAISNVTFLF